MAASTADLQAALPRYDEAVILKSDKLAEWDAWYRGPLRDAVRERAKSHADGAHLTRDELIQLMKWKLARGKFRPMLQQYAASNAQDLVRKSTSKGFALLRDADVDDAAPLTRQVLAPAIKAITEMKGVGPAMASALLALAHPQALPYMSDEMLAHGAGLRDKPKYNEKEYVWLVEQAAKRLDATPAPFEHSAEQLEKAAWAYGILKDKGVLDNKADDLPKKAERKAVAKVATAKKDDDASQPTAKRARKR